MILIYTVIKTGNGIDMCVVLLLSRIRYLMDKLRKVFKNHYKSQAAKLL